MNDEFVCFIESVVYKMIEDGKLFLQKHMDNDGKVSLSLNVVLEDDEKDENGNFIKYVANPSGKNGVKLNEKWFI